MDASPSVHRLSEYRYDPALNLYINPDEKSIQYSDGAEDYIYQTLKSACDVSCSSEELARYIKDWPSRYHLSPERINFIKGIAGRLNKTDEVLEIGSGCGAITRWLGEHCCTVDAIEGSLARAMATRERTRDLENVKVYFGNASTTCADRKYDVVTLIGVLEYAPLFDHGARSPEEAIIRMLELARSALKEEGILIVAIENRLGIKYLSGCSEDHTGKFFDNIVGYPEKSPVTLSHYELGQLISRAGFANIQFYHAFPDYKMTTTMIQEKPEVSDLYPYNWIHTPFEDYNGERLNLYPELPAIKTIVKANLLWDCSNSFIVLAGKGKRELSEPWLIKKFHTTPNHDKSFHHQIILTEDKSGYTVRRVTDGLRSIESSWLKYNLKDGTFVPGDLLSLSVVASILKKGRDQHIEVSHFLNDLHRYIMDRFFTGEYDEEGFPLVQEDVIDLTFWNIIVASDGSWQFIDSKWSANHPIPIDYVLFRNLLFFHNNLAPFFEDKNRSEFIISCIKPIYKTFSQLRLEKNIALEDEFQSIVAGRPVKHGLFTFDTFSVAQEREIIDRIRRLNLAVKNHMNGNDWTVTDKLRIIGDQQVILKEMEERIIAMESVLAEKDAHVSLLNGEISEHKARAGVLENMLREKDFQIIQLDNEIKGIRRSIIWQTMIKFQSHAVDRILPCNTRRRITYDQALKGLRIIYHEGWHIFLIRYKEYRMSKKMMKQTPAPPAQSHIPKHTIEHEPEIINRTVSVIIPTKNAGKEFEFTMEKLRGQKGMKGIEVIAIDSGSTDETLDIAKKYGTDVYTIRPDEFNHGRTRNYGASKASGDYLLFMVQDAIPIGDRWVYSMVKMLEDNKETAAVTCRQIPRSDADPIACFTMWNHYRALGFQADKIVSCDRDRFSRLPFMEKRKLAGLDDVSNCIRRDVFSRLMYNELNFAEDLDLGLRLIENGYKLGYLRSTGVIHSHNRSADYYLKRYYVDSKSLLDIFNIKPEAPEQGIDESINSIVLLYTSLCSAISSVSKNYGTYADTELFINGITEAIKNKSSERNLVAHGNSKLEDILADLAVLSENKRVSGEPISLSFFGVLNEFKGYYCMVTPNCDVRELTNAIYTIFSLCCGSYLGNLYHYKHTESKMMKIDSLLSKGV